MWMMSGFDSCARRKMVLTPPTDQSPPWTTETEVPWITRNAWTRFAVKSPTPQGSGGSDPVMKEILIG
jgi:hypothetical protein